MYVCISKHRYVSTIRWRQVLGGLQGEDGSATVEILGHLGEAASTRVPRGDLGRPGGPPIHQMGWCLWCIWSIQNGFPQLTLQNLQMSLIDSLNLPAYGMMYIYVQFSPWLSDFFAVEAAKKNQQKEASSFGCPQFQEAICNNNYHWDMGSNLWPFEKKEQITKWTGFSSKPWSCTQQTGHLQQQNMVPYGTNSGDITPPSVKSPDPQNPELWHCTLTPSAENQNQTSHQKSKTSGSIWFNQVERVYRGILYHFVLTSSSKPCRIWLVFLPSEWSLNVDPGKVLAWYVWKYGRYGSVHFMPKLMMNSIFPLEHAHQLRRKMRKTHFSELPTQTLNHSASK